MNIAKEAIIFGTGVAVGFAGGYFIFKAKYKKIADQEIEEVREYYSKKEQKKENKEPSEKSEEISIETIEKVADSVYLRPSDESVKTNYHRIGDEEIMLAEEESPEEDMPTKPYLITMDEYLNDGDDNEKLSLTYYNTDETLADDYGELVDVEETISSDIYNMLGQTNEDLYVRNPSLEIDYEIVHVDRSYADRYMP